MIRKLFMHHRCGLQLLQWMFKKYYISLPYFVFAVVTVDYRQYNNIINIVTVCCRHFYPRDAMLARVFAIGTCPSVCLSVCPSAARRYCA